MITDTNTEQTDKIKSLLDTYPYLIRNEGNGSLVTAAKNIRIELARAFPGVKFRVRSRRYWMGNYINVGWTDGPTKKQVEEIIDKYEAGSFDGMTDLYTYESTAWTDAFGEAKYISANRSYTNATIATVIDKLKLEYGNAQAPTVEDYNQGLAWNTTPMNKHNGRVEQHWSWQSIINRTLDEYLVI